MDEIAEFSPRVLELLRQPIEEGKVVLGRARGSVTYPCRFMLVAAMNPCPCGYYGSTHGICRCTPFQIRKHRSRISGPILDRIDLHVEVPRVSLQELQQSGMNTPSAEIRARVIEAREVQRKRYRGLEILINSLLTSSLIKRFHWIRGEEEEFLKSALNRLSFSARAYYKVIKIARTISDIEGRDKIEKDHLLEAVQYRVMDRFLPHER